MLRHFGTVALHIVLGEHPVTVLSLLVLTREVVPQCRCHARSAARVQRVKDQDARSGKKKEELKNSLHQQIEF